jgi:signal transduction histidine kinase
MASTQGLNVLWALVLGTLVLMVMALAIIFFVIAYQRRVIAHQKELQKKEEEMQREMLRATILSQEEEQRRIARDLHDDLGPMLSAVKLKVSEIKRKAGKGEPVVTELDESREMLDTTIGQVRGISHRLLPPILEDYGLVSAIESMCQKMNNNSLKIDLNKPAEYNRLTAEKELALYRVVMELINNIIKHSGATAADITLKQTPALFEITVSDNGKGFDSDNIQKLTGLGVKSMLSRIKAIDAGIRFQSSQKGTTVIITADNPA